jgi:hypothetical protein
MSALAKAVQTNVELERSSRGCMNGNYAILGNHYKEVTYNVQKGYNRFHYYHFESIVKFSNIEDAKEYLKELGVEEYQGVSDHEKSYYALTEQSGCCFTSIGFYR